jgi:hypothetical protein
MDYEIEWSNDFNSDCGGFGAKWICPICKDKLVWAPHMWWRLTCECKNVEWDFDIVIKRNQT